VLRTDGTTVECVLSRWETVGALHRSPTAALADLERIRLVPDPWRAEVLRGMRAPGTGIPWVILLGTMRRRGGKDFCAVRGRRPAYVLDFARGEFDRWVVSADRGIDPALAAQVED
jgi:hypothetical protein